MRFGGIPRGQTLVELALVLPLFTMVFIGIIVLGVGVFYQQQVTNAAREAARFATIHSATDPDCPVVSNRDPDEAVRPDTYYRCDTPQARWPDMTARARDSVFGLDRQALRVTACWSGYWTKDSLGNWGDWDESAVQPTTPPVANEFRSCTLPNVNPDTGATETVDPRTMTTVPSGAATQLGCPNPLPLTTEDNDMASNWSASYGVAANQVTVYVCYVWHPPMAGFLLIPSEVILRGVVTEAMEYQQ